MRPDAPASSENENESERGVPIDRVFYIRGDQLPNGSLDIEAEGPEPMLSLADITERVSEMAEDHGGTHFIVECRVIRKVSRGKVRVVDLPRRRT